MPHFFGSQAYFCMSGLATEDSLPKQEEKVGELMKQPGGWMKRYILGLLSQWLTFSTFWDLVGKIKFKLFFFRVHWLSEYIFIFWMVFSNIVYVHPYLGKIPILTSIFFRSVETTN